MVQCAPDQFAFVSLYTRHREPLLRSAEAKRLLLAAMMESKRRFRLNIVAYVLLDDHMHWLFASPPTNECSAIVNHLRAVVQKDWRILCCEESPVWEHGLQIELVMGTEQLRNHLDFIHYDPVRHGQVARPSEYKWSSLPARVAEGHYPEDWGCLAPPAGVARVLRPTPETA